MLAPCPVFPIVMAGDSRWRPQVAAGCPRTRVPLEYPSGYTHNGATGDVAVGNVPVGEVVCVGSGARGPEEYPPLPPALRDTVLALGDEELHRYGTRREVRRRTGGRRHLAPGTLHRSPRQVQEEGLVEGSEERPDAGLDDERRRYYRLTGLGGRAAVAEVERLEGLVMAARSKGLVPSARPSGAAGGA